jgi:glyoxylase-like metal-dependent hydrolase (beta-lactamase superfamily II)
MAERMWLRQLAAGRDFAVANPVARTMENFVYLVGDGETRECLVVDPAWDVPGILAQVDEAGFALTGALVSHWHPDHVGGSIMDAEVEGLAELLAQRPVPIHVHSKDAAFVQMMTGLSPSDLRPTAGGDKIRVGAVEIECLHTPGHTQGSQCFRCGQALISGDTLFLDGCGRVDLPGGDVEEMWRTLYERLLALPGDLVLYPGHDYGSAPSAPLSEVRRTNPVLRAPSYDDFRRIRG